MLINFFEFTFLIALALSSVSSKAIGFAWVLIVLAGMCKWIQCAKSPEPSANTSIIKYWLLVTLVALVAKTIPMVYWSDPWEERHGELRMFLGALALYCLGDSKFVKHNTIAGIATALSISCAIGLIWVSLYGRDNVSTHHIPWAGSMAMISALLLALSLKTDFNLSYRSIWFLGGLIGLMAVLSSQSRGAYGIVVWWIVVGIHHCWTHKKDILIPVYRDRTTRKRKALVAATILIGFILLCQSQIFKRTLESLEQASNEIMISQKSAEKGANSSVGARIYLWGQSCTAIQESPWIGYGHDGRKEKLAQWAEMAHSTTIKSLGHVHNEYLNQLLDHGFLGLFSQLSYIFGLMWLSWKLHKAHHAASALAVAGICFVHASSSLSNVNFAHNQYTATMSVLISFSLWISTLRPR
jgi:O-antigen ligase